MKILIYLVLFLFTTPVFSDDDLKTESNDAEITSAMTSLQVALRNDKFSVADLSMLREAFPESKCDSISCYLATPILKKTAVQVKQKYPNIAGHCLAGVKRLLNNALGSEWMTATVSAKDYVQILQKNKDEFIEFENCMSDKTNEYPNGTVFVFGSPQGCQKNGTMPNGKKCSYHGHIFVKISDTEEFAETRRPLTKWNERYPKECNAFIPTDYAMQAIKITDNDENDPDGICFIN